MTTEKATKALAEIYATGDSDTRAERAAESHLWDAEERVRSEEWGLAGYSLDAAYRALGAEPPDSTAEDFERGRHPIRVEAERLVREMLGEG
ncbi:MAG: hypothetical protein BGO49_24280 [Planctomycetales bacterium 71-10]|nr:MAG: hypothetical protein BGO49_24280 [Planctomycetales bacterium 71-10]